MRSFFRHALAAVLVAAAGPALADAQAQLSITHIQTGIVSSSGVTTSLFDQDTAISLSSQGGIADVYTASFDSGRALAADESFFVRLTVGLSVWDDGQLASFAPGYVFPNDEFAPVSGANDLALAWIGVGHALASEPGIERWGSVVKLATQSDDQSELYSQFEWPEGTVYAVGQGTGGPQTINIYAAVYAQGGLASPAPEPGTYALMLAGLGVLALMRRSRRAG